MNLFAVLTGILFGCGCGFVGYGLGEGGKGLWLMIESIYCVIRVVVELIYVVMVMVGV